MGKNRRNNDGGGRGRTHDQRRFNNRQENFKQAKRNCRRGGGDKIFPKFVDNERSNNQSAYWQHSDGNINNSFQNNGHTDAGIVPWFRENPINPLVIPRQHINFENDCKNENKEMQTYNNKEIVKEMVENPPTLEKSDKENTPSITRNDSMSTTSTFPQASEPPKIPVETNFSVKVEQKTDLGINLKQERKSSSSSSSSSESSSSEGETELANKSPVVAKTEITSTSKAPSSPLNIKLKPKITPVNSTPVKSSQKFKAPPDSSSSSSSSSSSDEEFQKSQEPVVTKQGTPILSKKKNNSEDDVVCIGNLENKIILEDESDEDVENEEPTKKVLIKKYKTSAKKGSEKCMICDKKGHTSFECQMICKNCSTPYHSYRTCPQPANLNTMLQIFMEFCMQQFQHFSTENAIHPSDNVPKPQVDSPNSIGASNQSKNLKRKLSKTNKSNTKPKSSKKRKVHISKKTKYKTSSNDSSDEDDSDETNSDSETSLEDSEDESSDSPVESVVSSKKKLKTKNKTTCFKTTSKSSNFSANPTNLPIVLNGFPNLTVPTVSVQNPNTSANALNTLLLTQMFQNAIGSLKQ